MPLALLTVASSLDPKRYETVIIDGRLEENLEEVVGRHVRDALCFGVTVMTGAPITEAVRISRAAKNVRPDLTIAWGGWTSQDLETGVPS